MSADLCEKCGMSKDICTCKEGIPATTGDFGAAQAEAIANGELVRCIGCNNLFRPDTFSNTLCGDCRSQGQNEEKGEGKDIMSQMKDSIPEPVVGHPDPVPENVEVSVKTNDSTTTFSAIPVIESPKVEIPKPENITLKLKNQAEKANEDAYVAEFIKNPVTLEVTLRGTNNDTGKPVEIHLTDDFIQKLIRELLPKEAQRRQVLLDKMHNIRETRGLSVEKIDKQLSDLITDSQPKFDGCKTGTDVKRVEAMVRATLSVLTQKRYLAKFSMHEESELSLQLAKLEHSENE